MFTSVYRVFSVSLFIFFIFLAITSNATANNDYGSLAVGVRDSLESTVTDAGAANIIRGSSAGLTNMDNQIWHQNSDGIIGKAERLDYFGDALASGDFNNDGYPDLAVGVSRENIGTLENAGMVNIIYGSKEGLTSTGNQSWHQNSSGMQGSAEADDYYGQSLATGDFNNDGFTDLAVGVPGEDIATESDAGAVHVIYGSANGLGSKDNQLWDQASAAIVGGIQGGNGFGEVLATGDFNSDGFDDLAISIPYATAFGRVGILYGSKNGLDNFGSQYWDQDSDGIIGISEEFEEFGKSLASEDFNNDGYSDLAIGVIGEEVDSNTGIVQIIYGSTNGLASERNRVLYRIPVEEGLHQYRGFGYSLAAGDFNNDTYPDLAIGIPGQTIYFEGWPEGLISSGAVQILYGSATGLNEKDYQFVHQHLNGSVDGVGFTTEGDDYGTALASGDFNGDGADDLAVGIPQKDEVQPFPYIHDSGAVEILYGSLKGLSDEDKQIWHQDSRFIEGSRDEYERYGHSLVYIPPNNPPIIVSPAGKLLSGAMFLLRARED